MNGIESVSGLIGNVSDLKNIGQDALNKARDVLSGVSGGEASSIIDKTQTGLDNLSDAEQLENFTGLPGKLSDQIMGTENYKPIDVFQEEDEEMGISAGESTIEETESLEIPEEESKQEKLKKQFKKGIKSIIPGLDLDSVLEKLAQSCKPLQDALKPIMDSIYWIEENKRISPEEKEIRKAALKEQRKKQIQAWKDSQKETVSKTINDIKADFEEIKFGVENMTVLVPMVISQIAMPTFIGTGAPNPARIIQDGIVSKKMLQGMIHPISTACCKLLDNCDIIKFDLPGSVLSVIESVTNIGKLIDSIPP